LFLNKGASTEIEWHCKHYVGRGLMKRFNNAAEIAKDMGISLSTLEQTFAEYNQSATK
jgi:DNA-binding phage protein